MFLISSRFLLRPYDVTITSNLLFVYLFMQFQLNCMRDVIFTHSGESFLFILVIRFLVTLTYLTLKNDLVTLEIDFSLLQLKVIMSSECVSQ